MVKVMKNKNPFLKWKLVSLLLMVGVAIFFNYKLWQKRQFFNKKLSQKTFSLWQKYPLLKGFILPQEVDKLLDKQGIFLLKSGNYLIITDKFCSNIIGYVDQIVMALLVSPQGKVINLCVIGTKENIPRAHLVEKKKYLKQFYNYNPLKEEKDFDIISGATYSSRCVIETVKEGVKKAFSLLKRKKGNVIEDKGVKKRNFNWKLLILLLFFLFPLFLRKIKSPQFLLFWQGAVVIFLGYGLFKIPFSVLTNSDVGHLLALVSGKWLVYGGGIFVFIFLTSFLWGRYYCSYLCPYGAVLGLGSKLFSKISSKFKINARWSFRLQLFHTFIFLIFFLKHLDLFLNNKFLLQLDPLSSFFEFNLGVLFLFILYGISILSFIWPRFWCRGICPLGEVLEVTAIKPLFPFQLSQADCRGCHQCIDKGCRYGAIWWDEKTGKAQIIPHLCFQCFECFQVCPIEKGLQQKEGKIANS